MQNCNLISFTRNERLFLVNMDTFSFCFVFFPLGSVFVSEFLQQNDSFKIYVLKHERDKQVNLLFQLSIAATHELCVCVCVWGGELV